MKGKVRRERFPLILTRYQNQVERRDTPTGGVTETFRRVAVGTASYVVEVEVDTDGLRKQLGPKAIQSKGQQAKEAGGLVVVKHLGQGSVAVLVDMPGLARTLGPAACRSKGGKSQDAGGLVIVRRVAAQ